VQGTPIYVQVPHFYLLLLLLLLLLSLLKGRAALQ